MDALVHRLCVAEPDRPRLKSPFLLPGFIVKNQDESVRCRDRLETAIIDPAWSRKSGGGLVPQVAMGESRQLSPGPPNVNIHDMPAGMGRTRAPLPWGTGIHREDSNSGGQGMHLAAGLIDESGQ